MDQRFHPEVERLLGLAGWRPGRSVHTQVLRWESRLHASDGAMPDAARQILTEFGGLRVGDWGPGETRARGPMEFDPVLALGEADERMTPVGQRLYPLGEVDFGHGLFFVAESGEVWSYSVDEVLRQLGVSIEEALERELLGKTPRQEIAPPSSRPEQPGDIAAR